MDQKKINNKLPVAWEGIPFIIIGIALTSIFFILGWILLAIPLAVLTLLTIYFFRDPERKHENIAHALLTPADGKILAIERLDQGDSRFEGRVTKISIFMSIFNAHVNRAPIHGKITDISYHPGKFFSANIDKASLCNEHNLITLETEGKEKVTVVQIAGLIARRIVCWVKQGDHVKTGQRFGLIRFGSRVEIYLPPESKILVKQGDKVKAGQTILGYLNESKK
jgi:phosphatidylserine decarboxylase